jgi:hypothetical protein
VAYWRPGRLWPFVFLVVAGGMVAGSTGTVECAGGDGGDGGSDTDISTRWATNTLTQTMKVPFCVGGQCAQASISTSRLWCAPYVPAQFKLPVCGTHFAFLTSIVIAAGHTRAPFPSTSSTTPSAPRRPCRGARGTLVRPPPRLHRWPLFSCLVPPATSLSSQHATPQLRCTLTCYASPPWLSRDSQGRRQRLDWTGNGACTRARMGGPRCMSR